MEETVDNLVVLRLIISLVKSEISQVGGSFPPSQHRLMLDLHDSDVEKTIFFVVSYHPFRNLNASLLPSHCEVWYACTHGNSSVDIIP